MTLDDNSFVLRSVQEIDEKQRVRPEYKKTTIIIWKGEFYAESTLCNVE